MPSTSSAGVSGARSTASARVMPRWKHLIASSFGAPASASALPRFAQASHRVSSARTTSLNNSEASRVLS